MKKTFLNFCSTFLIFIALIFFKLVTDLLFYEKLYDLSKFLDSWAVFVHVYLAVLSLIILLNMYQIRKGRILNNNYMKIIIGLIILGFLLYPSIYIAILAVIDQNPF